MSIRVYRLLPAAAAVLLFTSCASSERMVRMSGGVLDSYSIPEKHRLRSEKFRKTEQSAGSRKSLNEMEPGADGETGAEIRPVEDDQKIGIGTDLGERALIGPAVAGERNGRLKRGVDPGHLGKFDGGQGCRCGFRRGFRARRYRHHRRAHRRYAHL